MDENKEILISGTLNYKEFKKYFRYHTRKLVWGYFLFVVVLFLFLFRDSMFEDWFSVVFTLVLSFILSGVFTLILMFLMQMRVRKEYKSDQLIKNQITYRISDEGIHQKNGRSNAYFEWGNIISAHEHKELFLLYISKNKAVVLPKRYFNSSEEISSFKKVVGKNVLTKKVKMMK
ncbi:hypothetical protein JOC86_004212 [Bacillus pakistanensis]|uniref:YcxB-like C-terminal domain-containing protein n=1 Tax=Rossellomorea pakistanensis TaxID=992288 RepID=A0ABS2NIE6_9BACI|nr:YcxB family protein [Bacillus pakistanensis]MBM7587638.1 hypothetical protein [Bacillus pakistanensis]